ncbi:MAG: hypothetical protein EB157_04405, partial [Euryarchaeota archaeon]|nr:hypothetical protein [Euryarchaeota archaeon]
RSGMLAYLISLGLFVFYTKREEMRGRLRDLGYQQMRELMGIDDENKPSVDGDPSASMSRTNKDDLGRRIWISLDRC